MHEPDIEARLRSEVLACGWDALAPHHARGALLVVRPDLDLIAAASAIARDRHDRVEIWLAVGRIGRPGDDLVRRWCTVSPRFQFVIVQPFVVAQELTAADVPGGGP
jgi:hypothetical protein